MPVLSANMWSDAWYAIQTVLKVRSFQIVVLQGLVGSIPWASMVFFTMWFELIGMMLHFLISSYCEERVCLTFRCTN